MIVHQYPALLNGAPRLAEAARALARRTYEFTQFLVDVRGVTTAGARLTRCVTYHPSCHGLRNLGIGDQPERLLGQVEGLTTVPLPDARVCCGFGGLFSVKMPAVSEAMLEQKLGCIAASGADTVVTTDASCGMHLAGGLRRAGSHVRVSHIADVLDAKPADHAE
jgi:L-lactate dehydrogenase complex protein LldE